MDETNKFSISFISCVALIVSAITIYALNRPMLDSEMLKNCQSACLYTLEIYDAQKIEVGMMDTVTPFECQCKSNRYESRWFDLANPGTTW